MNYFGKLNNAELFATYALGAQNAWSRTIGRAVTHAVLGKGVILNKTGVILRVQFQGIDRFFGELEFFGSKLSRVEFIDLDLPPGKSREYLIDALCACEYQAKRSLERSRRGRRYQDALDCQKGYKQAEQEPLSPYRRELKPAELAYQKGLAKIEDEKLQRQKQYDNHAESLKLREEVSSRRENEDVRKYMRQEAEVTRDE